MPALELPQVPSYQVPSPYDDQNYPSAAPLPAALQQAPLPVVPASAPAAEEPAAGPPDQLVQAPSSTGVAPIQAPPPSDPGWVKPGEEAPAPEPEDKYAAPPDDDPGWLTPKREPAPMPETKPEDAGLVKGIIGGVLQGTSAEAKKAADLVQSITNKTSDWTHQEWIKNLGNAVESGATAADEQAKSVAPPKTLGEAYAGGWGSLFRWAAQKSAEQAPGLVTLMGISAAGGAAGSVIPGVGTAVGAITAPIVYGMMIGANQEARKPGATDASILTGAVVGGAEMGAPLPVLHEVAKLPGFKKVIGGALAMGGIGGATPYAEAAVPAARGEEYKPPSAEEVASGIIPGAIVGGVTTPLMPRPGGKPSRTPADEAKNIGVGQVPPGAEPMPQGPPLEPPSEIGYPPAPEPEQQGPPTPPGLQGTLPLAGGGGPGLGPAQPGLDLTGGRTGRPAMMYPDEAAAMQQGNLPLGGYQPTIPGIPLGRGGSMDLPEMPGAPNQGPATTTLDPAIHAATDQAINPPGATLQDALAAGAQAVQGRTGTPAGTTPAPTAPVPPVAPAPGEPLAPPATRPVPQAVPLTPIEERIQRYRGETPTAPVAAEAARPAETAPVAPEPVRIAAAAQPTEPAPSARPPEVAPTPTPEPTPIAAPAATITQAMHRELASRGFPAAVRRNMEPDLAREILSEPAQTQIGEHTVERDHTSPERYVAKDNTGEVVSTGSTPEEAVRAATASSFAGRVTEPTTPTTVVELAAAGGLRKAASATVGEEMAQREEARKAGEPAPTGPPTVKRPTPMRAKETIVGKRGAAAVAEEQPEEFGPPIPKAAPQRVSMMSREAARNLEEETTARYGEPTKPGTPVEQIGKSDLSLEEEMALRTKTRDVETVGKPAEGKAEARAKSTTSKDLQYGDLLHDILDPANKMTTAAAHAIVGTKEPGTRGRPRSNASFADYLDARIERARAGEATDQELVDRINEVMADKNLSPAQRIKQRDAIAKDYARLETERDPVTFKKIEAIRDEARALAEASTTRAAKGRKAKSTTVVEEAGPKLSPAEKLAQIQAQVRARRAAAGEGGGERVQSIGLGEGGKYPPLSPEERQLVEDKATGLHTPLAEQMARDSVNEDLRQRVVQSDRGGHFLSLKEELNNVADHTPVRAFAPHLAQLAKRIITLLGDHDIPLSTPRTLAKATGDRGVYPMEPGTRGEFLGDYDAITLNPDRERYQGHVETLLHEGVHAVTHPYLQAIAGKLKRGERLTVDETRHHEALMSVGREISRMLRDRAAENPAEARRLNYALSLKAGHEIMSMVTTSPYVQQVMARTRASAQFRTEMAKLGYGKPATAWQGFVRAIADIMKLPPTSALAKALAPITDIMEAGGQYSAARRTAIRTGFEPESMRASSRSLADGIPDQRVREQVRPLADQIDKLKSGTAMNAASDAVMHAATDVKSGIGGRVMRGAFIAATTDRLARFNRDVAPYLEKISNVKGRMAQAAKAFRDQTWNVDPSGKRYSLADMVQQWGRDIRTSKQLGSLMTNATMARAHLGGGGDETGFNFAEKNAHLKDDALKRAEDLQAQYDNLNHNEQKTYNGTRDYYHDTYLTERQAVLKNIISRAMPDATPEQVAALSQQASTRAGIEQLVRNPDDTNLAKMFQTAAGDQWPSNRAIVQEIAKAHQEGYVRGDYFPLRRNGNYLVRYTDPDTGQTGMEMFERKSQADVRRAEVFKDIQDRLRQNGEDPNLADVSQVLSKAEHPTNEAFVPEQILRNIDSAMSAKGLDPAAQDQVRQAITEAYVKSATRNEATLTHVPRRYIEGASKDQARNLANDLLATSNRMAHLQHGGAEMDAYRQAKTHLEQMEKATAITPDSDGKFSKGDLNILRDVFPGVKDENLIVPTSAQVMRARAAYHEMEARRSTVDGDQFHSQMAKGFTHLSLAYHLLRPAHLAVQTLDASMKSLGILGGKYGFGKAAMALQRAVRDIGPSGITQGFGQMGKIFHREMQDSGWNLHEVMKQRLIARGMNPEHAQALVDRGLDAGVLGHSQALELKRMATPGAFSSTMRGGNLMDLATMAEHAVDQSLRMANLKAGFDLAMGEHGDYARAVKEAVDLSQDAMPNYASWNRARVVGPNAASPLLRSGLAQAAMQYHTYGMQMYGTLTSLVRQAMFRPGERAEAVKTLAGLYGIHALMVGAGAHLFGVPLLAAMGAWDLSQGKKRPHDYGTDMRGWMTDTFGPTIGTIWSKGLLGAAGVDITRSVKLSNMMDIPELKTFDKAGYMDALLHVLTGASGDVSGQLLNSGAQILQGDVKRGVMGLAPRMIADPLKAFMEGQEGVRDARGHVVLSSSQVTPGMQAAQALGFRPYELSLAQERRGAEFALQNESKDAHQQAIDAFVKSGDLRAARAYTTNPTYMALHPLNYQQLTDAKKKQLESMALPTYGVTVPKSKVPLYMQSTRFQ